MHSHKQSSYAWIPAKFDATLAPSLVYLSIKLLKISNKIKENMINDQSKFRTNLFMPTQRIVRAKNLSVIHGPLKVDHFELLIN